MAGMVFVIVVLLVAVAVLAWKWHCEKLLSLEQKSAIEGRDAVIANLRTELDRLAIVNVGLQAQVGEFSKLDRCYSADGLTCGWHNMALSAHICPISNKRVVNGDRKVYKPQGRLTGSQLVRRMEAQAATEE